MVSVTIPMRCGKTGGRFRVIFTREDSKRRFRVQAVRLGSSISATSSSAKGGSAAGQTILTDDGVDWNGWYCPACQYGKDSPAEFVRCNSCNELVCGATIRELRDGVKTFECFCGGSGRIGGTIEQYSAASGTSAATNPALPPGTNNPQLGRGS